MGNKLFAIAPSRVIELFEEWGWERKRDAKHSDGHFFVWPATGQGVVVAGPKARRHERGNALAMKDAYRIMGLSSVQVFLAGPQAAAQREMKPAVDVDGIDLAALERAQQQAASHVTKEAEMPVPQKGEWPENKGYSENMARMLKARPMHAFTVEEILEHMHASGLKDLTRVSAGGLLSQNAKLTKPGKAPLAYVERVGRGVYRWNPDKYAVKEPIARTQDTPPVSSLDETPAAPAPAAAFSSSTPEMFGFPSIKQPQAVPANGSTPDLLSKVASMDGGKYLFQGDDGALYVLRDVVRLEV